MTFERVLATATILAFATDIAGSARAQEAGMADAQSDAPVIVVTAQKRQQDWLDVPIALSVQGAEDLRQERSLNSYDILRQVPGVTGSNPGDELTQVAIRGVSSEDYGVGSDPTVGVFFDGVYLGRNENTATNFIDLERAEIARGPQGALFGRATPGGAISLVPVRPGPQTELSGTGELGTRGLARTALVGNVPLAPDLFARGSFVFDRSGDYVTNLANGDRLGAERSLTGRLALRYRPGSATTLDLTGWYEDFAGDPWLYRNFPETVPETVEGPDALPGHRSRFDYIREIYSDVPASDLDESRKNWGGVLRLEHEFDSGLSLLSITSALGYRSRYLEDFDGTDLFLFNYGQNDRQSLLTQEFRLVSGDGGPVRWFAGALAYREKVRSTIVQSYGDFDLCVFYEFDDEAGCAAAGDEVTDTFIFARSRSRGVAFYGEGEIDLTDRLVLTGGLRFTRDEKRLVVNAPTPGGFLPADEVGYTVPTDGLDVARRKAFTSWQPRLALTFRPVASVSLYGVYSEGEKPGGFDTFDAFSPAFDAEKVRTLEAGAKGLAIGGRLTYSLAAYTTDYSQLQVLVSDGPRDIVKNAASARARGLELEATYKHRGVELGVRGALIDARFRAFADPARGLDYGGNRLAYTPRWSAGATLALEQGVGKGWAAFGRIDADVQGRQFLTPANDRFASNPCYERIDLRAGLRRDDGLEVYAFGQNVTAAAYAGYADVTDYDQNFGAYLGQFSRPAVFGIGINLKT